MLRSGTIAMLAVMVADLAMIFVAVTHYPPFFSQPAASTIVAESVSTLVVYAVAAVWVGRRRGQDWDAILASATLFGLFGGALEALNIGIENGIPAATHTPVLPIAFMLTILASWGLAGFRTACALHSTRAGLAAAVSTAGIGMLIAVTAGFVMEFFAARPEPAYISTWAEFRRSGWTDARAFGVANTLEAAVTHLVIAPIAALVLGGVASLLGKFRSSKETSGTPAERSGSRLPE
jgi:hypothetical protein